MRYYLTTLPLVLSWLAEINYLCWIANWHPKSHPGVESGTRLTRWSSSESILTLNSVFTGKEMKWHLGERVILRLQVLVKLQKQIEKLLSRAFSPVLQGFFFFRALLHPMTAFSSINSEVATFSVSVFPGGWEPWSGVEGHLPLLDSQVRRSCGSACSWRHLLEVCVVCHRPSRQSNHA